MPWMRTWAIRSPGPCRPGRGIGRGFSVSSARGARCDDLILQISSGSSRSQFSRVSSAIIREKPSRSTIASSAGREPGTGRRRLRAHAAYWDRAGSGLSSRPTNSSSTRPERTGARAQSARYATRGSKEWRSTMPVNTSTARFGSAARAASPSADISRIGVMIPSDSTMRSTKSTRERLGMVGRGAFMILVRSFSALRMAGDRRSGLGLPGSGKREVGRPGGGETGPAQWRKNRWRRTVAWSGWSPHTGLASDQVDDVSVCLR
jgi:hypothetical protein